MSYNLSNLLRDAIRMQGQDAFDIRVATGGSATTLVDTTVEDKYSEDEMNDGSIIVLRTAINLAPQDEFARISAYSEEDSKWTFSTLTASVASGDTCMLVSPEYPIRVLIELANDALLECGKVDNIDETITTTTDTIEYSLPAVAKKLVNVYLQTKLSDSDDNGWTRVQMPRIIPSAGNVDALMQFSAPFTAGYKLQLVYSAAHPTVSAYNSAINEGIEPQLIALMLADKIMQWSGVNNSNVNYANKIQSELMEAKRAYPILRTQKKTQFATFQKVYN